MSFNKMALAALLLLIAPNAFGQFALVANTGAPSLNGTSITAPNASSPAGMNCTTSSCNTTGANLIIISTAAFGFSGACTPTDNKGNTYSLPISVGSGNEALMKLAYASPATGTFTVGTGHTFSCGGSGTPAMQVLAFSGAATGLPIDATNSNLSSGATTLVPCSGSPCVTPSANNELVVTSISYCVAETTTISAGYTRTNNVASVSGTNMGDAIAYQIQTTATAQTPTWTMSGSGCSSAAVIATFKSNSGGGSTKKLFVGGGFF